MASPWFLHSAILLMTLTVISAILPRHRHMQSPKSDFHLPQSVIPTAYAVTLHPCITKGNYNGSVRINVTCKESTNVITLHGYHFNISDVKITNGDSNLEITSITRDVTNETICLSMEKELESGASYQLYFEFQGDMLTEAKFFSNPYDEKNVDGLLINSFRLPNPAQERWDIGVSTSPRALRRVFPCFDEPSFKATFQISITHWSNMSALSTMPIESSELIGNNLVYDHFSMTPPLSTSSVNVVVFHNDTTGNYSTGDIVHYHKRQNFYSTISRPTTNITAIMLQFLQEYLNVPYPLPKLDIVGVPNLFYQRSSLGLIVLQEFLMTDGTNIATELVNQWFKHMTTPECSEFFNITDILSEFMINSVIEKFDIKLGWRRMQKDNIYKAFKSYHTVGQYQDPFSIFKGSWFLQMLNSSLTEKTLQTALSNLVKNNMYSTYTPDMLWEEITKQSHADGTLFETMTVKEIAHSWLNNQGVPVLTVTRNYGDGTASLQQHVNKNKINKRSEEAEQEHLWPIPITYLTNSMQETSMSYPVMWLVDKEMAIDNLPDANSFIIVNPTDSGMFLVNYDKHNWALISESLLSDECNIAAQTRRKVVQDAMLLASTGEIDWTTALNVTLFLFNETDYTVWMPFIQNIHSTDEIFQNTPVAPKLDTYIRLLVSSKFGSTTRPDFNPNDPDYSGIWFQARMVLQKVGYQPLIDEMYRNMNRTMPLITHYDNETDLVIFCPKDPSNESEWPAYTSNIQQFAHLNGYLQRKTCECPGYIDFVERTLKRMVDEEEAFMSFEFHQMINIITICPESYNITYNFFLEHFNTMKQKYFYIKDVWNALITGVVSKIQNEVQLERMTLFFEENEKEFGYSSTSVRNGLKMAKRNIDKYDTKIKETEVWLDQVLPLLKKHHE